MIDILVIDIGYLSFDVVKLRFMKSKQTLSFPFFFSISIMLEIYSAYLVGLMNPSSNIHFISFFT
jgi:hypothetical protein